MKKVLIIVDAQYDFIEGSLKVEGAKEAINNLTEYIKSLKGDEYEHIFLTMDSHPANHCSFIPCGGQWPIHCVTNTKGADIDENLRVAVAQNPILYTYLTKGDNASKEEYSVLANEKSNATLLTYLSSKEIEQIDIVGIAAEYCVKDTMVDLKDKGFKNIVAITRYIGFLNKPSQFVEFLEKNNFNFK